MDDIIHQNPENLRHRSNVVIHNGIAYFSGVIPTDSSTDIRSQTQQVLDQLDERLALAGSSKERILSATIWMEDVNRDVAAFNTVWNEWVAQDRPPARSCLQATLQKGSLLEIAVIAALARSEAVQ